MVVTTMSSKIPTSHNARILAAAAVLILFWVIGLNLPRLADGNHLSPASSTIKPDAPSSPTPEQNHAYSLSDLVLGRVESDALCSRFHLKTYDKESTHPDGKPHIKPPRKIFDLLLVTTDTSIDTLELHLAQMSPFVDFFVLLESPSIDELTPKPEPTPEQDWWERDVGHTEPAPPSTAPNLPPTDADALSFLDRIWESRLYPYHDKIIRRTLSQFSSEFAPGQDHVAAAQNAVYTQVVPFLTGPQKAELGDVLIVSDIEEMLRPGTLQVLRNCAIPHITTVRTRKYWYSFQWMRMDGAPVSREPEPEPPTPEEIAEDPGLVKRSDNAAIHGRSNEFWSHPQVTIYEGTQTLMPDDLRKDRSRDEYTFADGGWTCKLCYGSIAETLTRAGQMGLIWHHGPRWKSAGRTVNRFMTGVDLFDRTNLSRIEANPDIPFYLRDNPHRFPWMLDRDRHGASFIDFDEAEYQAYLAKQDEVDSEKDIEDGTTPHIWNIATTQPWNDPEFAPALDVGNMPIPFRYPIPHVGPGDSWTDGGPQPQVAAPELSEEDRSFLEEAKEKIDSGLSAAEIAILEHLAEGQSLPAYGED